MTGSTSTSANTSRKARLDALALGSMPELAAILKTLPALPHRDLRTPEAGLVMLRGRTGGGGAPFNLGEATAARASVVLETGEVGHGYALGRDLDKVRAVAFIDAAAQRPELTETVDNAIAEHIIAPVESARKAKADETEATKVRFFTMVRGED